jgi:hypothetical protein
VTRAARFRQRPLVGVLVLLLFGSVDASAYELDFHYYVVYLVLRARGHLPDEADRLAGFSQFVDDNGRTEPLYCSAENRARFHFAGSAKDVATVANVMQALKRVTDAFWAYTPANVPSHYVAGAAMHLLADTFSHATFTAWRNRALNCREGSWRPCIGHGDTAESGHAPDRPYNDPPGALAAAQSIYSLVPAALGGTPMPWPTVEAQLAAALPAGPGPLPPIDARVEQIRAVIRRLFGDNPRYEKSKFATERSAFNAALGR